MYQFHFREHEKIITVAENKMCSTEGEGGGGGGFIAIDLFIYLFIFTFVTTI